MLSLESSLYVLECERRFALQQFERLRKLGLAGEVENMGAGPGEFVCTLARHFIRLVGLAHRRPAGPASAAAANPAAVAATDRRLCVTIHRHVSLVCAGCGAVVRAPKPACSPVQRRARKQRPAAGRRAVAANSASKRGSRTIVDEFPVVSGR